jgi:immunity protein 44 of polymorphic toxin system
MELWMSAELDSDVFEDFRFVRESVQRDVNALLSAADYGGKVADWAAIPMITTRVAPEYKEVARLSKDGRSAEFRLRISHSDFKQGTPHQRRRLLLDMLATCVRLMSELGARGLDAERLSRDIQRLSGGK